MSKTKVTVKAGESIVIGGLRQQEITHSETKGPILGSTPFLKPVFSKTETHIHNSVLTIFITPRVLENDEPVPEWTQIENGHHRVVPIMENAIRPPTESKDTWSKKTLDFLGL